MSQYTNRIIGKPIEIEFNPFSVVPYTGDIAGFPKTPVWSVNSGICLSTFSYDKGSYVPIEGLNQGFVLEKDSAVYLDYTVLPNMQISDCKLKITKVGKDGENDETNWVDYPDFYKIRPFDEKNSEGKVIRLVDGKRQEKGYLLIGKCSETYDAVNQNYKIIPIKNSDSKETFYFTQYVNTDLILMYSYISGIATTFPFPYFGGPFEEIK